jgi:hypothetical protein
MAQPPPSPSTLLRAQLLVAQAKKQQKKDKAKVVSKVKRGKENQVIEARSQKGKASEE